jgi:predicted O-methyltransferase YrrM
VALLPELARSFAVRGVRRAAGRLGYEVLPRTFYSPVPDLSVIPDSVWEEPGSLPGIELHADAQLRYLEEQLAPYMAEFRPPLGPTSDPRQFFLQNGSYESVDAETLYAIIRREKPQRIIEVGSGYSTLVSAAAATANGREHRPVELIAVEPHPRSFLAGVDEITRLLQKRVTEVPVAEFETLEAGDVLFIDSTHTVKTGGDVNYLVLEILPRLRPGVLIHFHDIFLPWEYPREWAQDLEYYWAEQYLVQAFLAMNARFEVLLAAHHLARDEPSRVAKVVPSYRTGASPGAFWIRRLA